ncbi:MAG: hypothetical protein WEB07_01290 [Natronospirillum sp.]
MRTAAFIALLTLALLLSGCANQALVTQQPGNGKLQWGSEYSLLPEPSDRYDIDQPLPSGTAVTLDAPTVQLNVSGAGAPQQIERLRLYTDSNGLPLIEMPVEPFAAAAELQTAMAELDWTVRRVRLNENRIDVDGSPWLERRTDQLIPARPVVEVYFYALGNGTQVHLERLGEDQPFPIGTQRELLEQLFAALP